MFKKILFTLLIAFLLFIVWIIGLQNIYAHFLLYVLYIPLLVSPETTLHLSIASNQPIYTVVSFINHQEYTWSLSGELFLLPFVLLLAWQIFQFFVLPSAKARIITRNNMLVMVLCQLLYLWLLTFYWKFEAARIIHDMMNNNLVILALFLIIKDVIRHRIFDFDLKWPNNKSISSI